MSNTFVTFTNAHTKKPIVVNSNRVRTAEEVDGRKRVRLVMDAWEGGAYAAEVEGDLQSVWDALMSPQAAFLTPP